MPAALREDNRQKRKVANEAVLNLFGYHRHELIDQPVQLLFAESDYQQIFAGPIPGELARRGFFSDAEVSLRSKHGQHISISLAGSVVRDRNNICQGIAFIARDITRRKLQEQELRRYQERLEDIVAERTSELKKTYARLQRVQKLEYMGTLAGGVAHDLNNILSGIVTCPELLLMDLADDSPLRPPIFAIRKSGEKAAAIVSDLLTLARRGASVRNAVNLNRVVQEYMQSPEKAKLQSYHSDAEIVTRLDPALQNITGSPFHLSKSLMNLVHNGFEAMPRGGTLHITTENRRLHEHIAGYESIAPGRYVVLSVADDGVGIAQEDLEHIFEPFYTKKKMGQSGTGLGMAVVWATVKDHGGYIDLASREEKGTIVSLYFPASARQGPSAPGRMPHEAYMGKGEAVLVVDDAAEQREIACRILKRLGYNVQAVASGEAAVAHVKDVRVDILLLDMIMRPGIDGLETYKRILAIPPNQKAILASGFSENERVSEAMALGVGAFIQKPYAIEQIGTALRTVLDKPTAGE